MKTFSIRSRGSAGIAALLVASGVAIVAVTSSTTTAASPVKDIGSAAVPPAVAEYQRLSSRASSALERQIGADESLPFSGEPREITKIDGRAILLAPGPTAGTLCLTVASDDGSYATGCQDADGVAAGQLILGVGGSSQGLGGTKSRLFGIAPIDATKATAVSAKGTESALEVRDGVYFGTVDAPPTAIGLANDVASVDVELGR